MTCKLFEKQAPEGVANFIALAEGTKDWKSPTSGKSMKGTPLYNGTVFHRVIPEFMIQGGDPAGTGMGGPGYKFDRKIVVWGKSVDLGGRRITKKGMPNYTGSQV